MNVRLLELPPELVRNAIFSFLSLGDIRKIDRSVVAANQKRHLREIFRGTLIPFAYIEHKTFSWLKDRGVSVQAAVLSNSVVDDDFLGVEAVMEKCIKLDINNNYEITSYGLCDLMKGCHRLQSFSLTSEEWIGIDFYSTLASNNPDLREFIIDEYLGTSSPLLAVAQHCPKLEKISLNCTRMMDEDIMHLVENCNCLVDVDFGVDAYLSDVAVAALAVHCPNLKQLNVKCCGEITDESISMLRGLTSLCIDDCCGITGAGIANVARNNPDLVHLSMESCDVTTAALMSLASNVPQLRSLFMLQTPEISDEGLCALATGCTLLEQLSLGPCQNITDAAVLAIAQKCANLKDLTLAETNGLTNLAVVHLAQHTTSLTRVCLDFPFVSCESVMSQLVNNNSSLRRLELPKYFPFPRDLETFIKARGIELWVPVEISDEWGEAY